MAFQLRRAESVGKGVKRLVRKQIDNALETLGPRDKSDERVHDARKCFKKVRALLRLVRDELGDKIYREENTCFRDAARPLTEIRDAEMLLETLDSLTTRFPDQLSPNLVGGVREELRRHKKAERLRVLNEKDAFSKVTAAVEDARKRIGQWTIRSRGWSILQKGLKRVCTKGRQALADALADPTLENLHEWRKQAKYLWHQLQILEPIWTPRMQDLAKQVHVLTELLGDDHNLAVLRQHVAGNPAARENAGTLEILEALIDRRRQELQQAAFSMGQWVYLDKPNAFGKRIKRYWKAWRGKKAETAIR